MAATITAPRGLRVAELAASVGVGTDTIRFYEKTGLLLAPARTPADYRVYEASAVDRLRFIQGTQRLGLKLRDIKELLAIRDTGVCPCEPAEELLRRRLADVDAEMARLSALREQMVAMVEPLPSQHCPRPLPGSWCPPRTTGGDSHAYYDLVVRLRPRMH
jgi:DNA-binding transcriptional MerR regulator